MKLHSFFRSGTSHRTRIALNLKGLDYDLEAVNLREKAHKSPEFLKLNPQGLVPAFETDGDGVLFQSPAIIEYLEERYPEPPLLPKDPAEKARARAMAALIACDIHPINNLRILNYLRAEFGADEAGVNKWCGTWITAGFEALESLLPKKAGSDGVFACGSLPGVVEACLIPQVYSAQRFKVDLAAFPRIVALDAACNALPAFQKAHPDAQPDAV